VDNNVSVIAYGVLAGGFLTDEWVDKAPPSPEVYMSCSGVLCYHNV